MRKRCLDSLQSTTHLTFIQVLINLNSGEVVGESVNVFQAQEIGKSLIKGVAGTSAFDCNFRKKDMAITIKTNAYVNI